MRLPRLIIALAAGSMVALGATLDTWAQVRAQFPSMVPGAGTYTPPSTFGSPPTGVGSTLGAPTAVPPPPTWDPYSVPSPGGVSPSNVPYATPQPTLPGGPTTQAPWGTTPPPPPQQPGSLYPNGLPLEWQQAGVGGSEGTVQRFQRLLQQLSAEYTWLTGKHVPREFEWHRLDLAATFGIPAFFNPDRPFLVTPGFAFNWLEGPIGRGPAFDEPDLPPRLYDAYLDISWYPKLTPWLSGDLGFRTGVWSDFKRVDSKSVRYLGRGLGVLSFTPRFDLLVGVVYLDRNNIKLLPAGGIHWRPNPDCDLYLVFPYPKWRRRFTTIGNSDWWWYVAGEYGGGAWTVERIGGVEDNIDYNDIRVSLGFEWETQTQLRGHIAIGYVWQREVLFAQTLAPTKFKPRDTLMVRAGVDF